MRMGSHYLQTACKHPLGLTLAANIKLDAFTHSSFLQNHIHQHPGLLERHKEFGLRYIHGVEFQR